MRPEFYNLWPLILIIARGWGLLTSDRDEWLVDPSKLSRKAKPKAAKKTAKRKVSRKSKMSDHFQIAIDGPVAGKGRFPV